MTRSTPRLFFDAHHPGSLPAQLKVVCSLVLQPGCEGPTLISCTAFLALVHPDIVAQLGHGCCVVRSLLRPNTVLSSLCLCVQAAHSPIHGKPSRAVTRQRRIAKRAWARARTGRMPVWRRFDRTCTLPHLMGHGLLNHKDTKTQRHEVIQKQCRAWLCRETYAQIGCPLLGSRLVAARMRTSTLMA